MNKKELMEYLYLDSDDIKDPKVLEKLFCLAIMQENIEIMRRISTNYIKYKDILNEGNNDASK